MNWSIVFKHKGSPLVTALVRMSFPLGSFVSGFVAQTTSKSGCSVLKNSYISGNAGPAVSLSTDILLRSSPS
jgi:hypothetical protein